MHLTVNQTPPGYVGSNPTLRTRSRQWVIPTLLSRANIYIKNMSQTRLVKVANKKTGEVYHTSKNKKKVERKLKLMKYSAKLRKHVEFTEIKK